MDTSPQQSGLSPKAKDAIHFLKTALRRRGLSARNGELPGAVVVEHQGREITVRMIAGRWYRPMSGTPGVNVPVGASGGEDALARHLARELTGRLP